LEPRSSGGVVSQAGLSRCEVLGAALARPIARGGGQRALALAPTSGKAGVPQVLLPLCLALRPWG
jgi:hypothetical protein